MVVVAAADIADRVDIAESVFDGEILAKLDWSKHRAVYKGDLSPTNLPDGYSVSSQVFGNRNEEQSRFGTICANLCQFPNRDCSSLPYFFRVDICINFISDSAIRKR